MVRRSRSIPLPEPASLTNSLKICERCRLDSVFVSRQAGHLLRGQVFDVTPAVRQRENIGH
jgi:hypothetical protein